MDKYNLEQKSAIIYPEEPLLILAGAGTGKTTTIIARIEHLIKYKKSNPSSILVLTFTKKATENLKNKLLDIVGSEA